MYVHHRRAVSLNPFYEGNDLGAMIDDDRLIIETRPHWMFGIDNSGDIRQGDNIRSFWQRAREDGCAPCALVTGDGSIDCNDNPGEQEAVTAQLHYCELIAALGLLKPGGNLVLKAFTLYEHSSICMLRLMASCFDRLLVVKPATSKSGNSETCVFFQFCLFVVKMS
jgi:23S rRNA U2552 (ribose-2'-O)-methylase RlmE/FtsJ